MAALGSSYLGPQSCGSPFLLCVWWILDSAESPGIPSPFVVESLTQSRSFAIVGHPTGTNYLSPLETFSNIT